MRTASVLVVLLLAVPLVGALPLGVQGHVTLEGPTRSVEGLGVTVSGVASLSVAGFSSGWSRAIVTIYDQANVAVARGSATSEGFYELGLPTPTRGTYTFRARVSDDLASAESDPLTIQVAGKPSAPRSLVASNATPFPSVTLSWAAPADDGGSPIVTYQIYRMDEVNFWKSVGYTPALTFKDTSPPPDHNLVYAVYAMSEIGFSPEANVTLQRHLDADDIEIAFQGYKVCAPSCQTVAPGGTLNVTNAQPSVALQGLAYVQNKTLAIPGTYRIFTHSTELKTPTQSFSQHLSPLTNATGYWTHQSTTWKLSLGAGCSTLNGTFTSALFGKDKDIEKSSITLCVV